jgi:hypothetical protein
MMDSAPALQESAAVECPVTEPIEINEAEAQLIEKCRAHIQKGNKAAEKAEQHFISAGQCLRQLREGRDQATFLALVEQHLHVKKSRAYELLSIADGKKTFEEVKEERRERQRRQICPSTTDKTNSQAPAPKPASASDGNGVDPEVAAEAMKAKFAAMDDDDGDDGDALAPLVKSIKTHIKERDDYAAGACLTQLKAEHAEKWAPHKDRQPAAKHAEMVSQDWEALLRNKLDLRTDQATALMQKRLLDAWAAANPELRAMALSTIGADEVRAALPAELRNELIAAAQRQAERKIDQITPDEKLTSHVRKILTAAPADKEAILAAAAEFRNKVRTNKHEPSDLEIVVR